jgi:hypothetical protein
VGQPDVAIDEEISPSFVGDLARGIVELFDEMPSEDDLRVPLGLSLWMRRHEVGLGGTIEALRRLRRSLLESSGLDAGTEPVPLALGDKRTTVLNFAVYLDALVTRAAEKKRASRSEVTEAALALIGVK